MDRSYLSDQEIVKISRDFVCVRLATYESEKELPILKSVFVGRSGELENTVFTIYDPEGKEKLVRAGRSPDFAFRDPREMAAEMKKIAQRYRGRENATAADLGLPLMADGRLALNVAACDDMPLVVVLAEDADRRKAIERKLTELAWREEFVGRFAYVSVERPADLPGAHLGGISEGIAVVAPGAFGLDGKVIASAATGSGADAVENALRKAMEAFHPDAKDYREHISKGRREGVHWETATPVTDPMSLGKRPPGR